MVYVGDDEVQQGGVAIMMTAGQKESRWNGRQLAKGSLQHNSTRSTKKCRWYKHMHQQMRRWMRKRMNSATSCGTLFQAATKKNMIVVMGDLNAKVGNNNTNREEVVGKFGVGVMNDNGGSYINDVCSANGFIIS